MSEEQPATTQRRPGARDRILAAAGPMFYAEGFGAVGIDRIIAEAGVAKASLYAHFESKDDLIVAYLQASDRGFWEWIDGSLDADLAPEDALVRIFELIEAQASDPTCFGCTFQVTAAEFPSRSHPAHTVAAEHKAEARRRFETLAAEAEIPDPATLAQHLLMIMDGAWASVRMFGPPSHPLGLGPLARAVIESHH